MLIYNSKYYNIMKVYNFGSDYAYQHKLRKECIDEQFVKQTKEKPIKDIESKEFSYAGDKIRGGGEGEVEAEPETKAPKKRVKKKETRSEEKKPTVQESGEI